MISAKIKTKTLQCRVTPEEFRRIAAAAAKAGVTVSEWIRGRLAKEGK